MYIRPAHPLNAPSSPVARIIFTPLGMSMEVKAVSLNDSPSIDVTLFGIVTDFSPYIFIKALLPMRVMPSSIMASVAATVFHGEPKT
ncbi:hypothetical protein R80B4_02598 [Fibrobacteres bacterium R8-0-B4]